LRKLDKKQFITEEGKRIIFYKCDPSLNVKCRKSGCLFSGKGECKTTTNAEAKQAKSLPFYLRALTSDKVGFEEVGL
jgi:hypothetical protein